VRTSARADQ